MVTYKHQIHLRDSYKVFTKGVERAFLGGGGGQNPIFRLYIDHSFLNGISRSPLSKMTLFSNYNQHNSIGEEQWNTMDAKKPNPHLLMLRWPLQFSIGSLGLPSCEPCAKPQPIYHLQWSRIMYSGIWGPKPHC